jgi:MinD-like ATPase involved in chromosome partitioning or flagellar assembly
MYITTFYSFKGGTGRSMALVNVAADLISRGRRVLIVDFDLEAPGLDTFPFTPQAPNSPGLVDFITDYLASGEVPDVSGYAYEAGLGYPISGKLWVMSAGRQDDNYDAKFKKIDWQDLYEHHNGFLLFEHLKLQWEEAFNPDYVLIDSRTGHTDIGGICTRQLPDAVVVMFFPNDQNLRGLFPIVSEIRAESKGVLNKEIELHFVMSNLPDVPDEDEIVAAVLSRFKSALEFDELTAVIHHFNSLAMLDQTIFVTERSRSKLAREYRTLTTEIVRSNPADREGVLAFLDDVFTRVRVDRESVSLPQLEDQLKLVKVKHPSDTEVLRRLSRLRRVQRKDEEALSLLDQIVESGVVDGEILIARAEMLAQAKRDVPAIRDLAKLFLLPSASVFDLSVAVRLKAELDPQGLAELVDSPSIMALSGRGIAEVVHELERSYSTIRIGRDLLREWLLRHSAAPNDGDAFLEYTLCLIGSGSFEEAISAMREHADAIGRWNIFDTFNSAMAEWGRTGSAPPESMSRVIEMYLKSGENPNPNWLQCIALAYWSTGDLERATEYFNKSLEAISGVRDSSFSAWSYLFVSAEAFVDDLYEMKSLFTGLPLAPKFIRIQEQTPS